MIAKPWTEDLLEIKKEIESSTNYNYDVCLLNYYLNGKEGFRFHSDKEEIGNNIPIASISLGAGRKFYFRSSNKFDDDTEIEKHSIILEHGSLLIMGKGTHENYVHSLPIDNKIKKPRLNLTFRKTRPINNPTLIENKTIIVNRKITKEYDIYIGRGTIYGNPFIIGRDGDILVKLIDKLN